MRDLDRGPNWLVGFASPVQEGRRRKGRKGGWLGLGLGLGNLGKLGTWQLDLGDKRFRKEEEGGFDGLMV